MPTMTASAWGNFTVSPHDQYASFVVPSLRISIPYPVTSGSPQLTNKASGSICDYTVTFPKLGYISVCAFSLDTVEKFDEHNTAGEWHIDASVWNRDKKELETLPVGAACSHPSIYGCSIIALDDGLKALSFYDYRPDTKAYIIYSNGYLIQFAFDVYDAFSDMYQNSGYLDGIAPWIETGQAPAEVLREIRGFRDLVNGVKSM